MMRRSQGFTLIEVMITVAVIAILASFAYPSYQNYMAKTYRTEGKRELVRLSNLMEQYFLDSRKYPTDLSKLGLVTSSSGFETEDGHYVISASQTTVFDYTLKASPQGVQATRDSSCGYLTLDNLGTKGAQGSVADCWR
nr:type IV pilin protein [Corallincola spongiicola]